MCESFFQNKVKNIFLCQLDLVYLLGNQTTTTMKKRLSPLTSAEYQAVKRMSKQQILDGILYRIHGLTVKDSKWDLTNAYFESRLGSFYIIGDIPLRSILVETDEFYFSHMRSPKGFGTWAFKVGDTTVWHSGKYSEACKAAKIRAQELNINHITVLP